MLIDRDEETTLKEILKCFINRECIFRCDPNIQYAPGIPKGTIPGSSPDSYMKWQFYLRNLTQDGDMSCAASMLMINQMIRNNENFDFQLTGLETSSIPLISTLQAHMRRKNIYVDTFIVRKERKGYGLFNIVDGKPSRKNFCVIDDILNSGSSLNKVLDTTLYEFDLDPHFNAYFILKMNKDRKERFWNGTRIKLNSLFVKDDFDFEFTKKNYWLPFDCDKSFNKRPDYK